MRKLVLALILLLASVMATAAPASADEPSMRADSSGFELFGTRFCLGPALGCDVTVASAAEPEPIVVAPADGIVRVTIFGLTLCSKVPEGTAPHCDVAWSPPQPAARWRDYPEIRTLAALDR